MSENGQTHFKNLADHFGKLCIKGLKTEKNSSDNNISCINATYMPPANVRN